MSRTPLDLPPPGWYADPAGQAGYRWWDGAQWTGHRRPAEPGEPSDAPRIPVGAAWWGLVAVTVGVILSVILQAVAAVLFPGSGAANLLLGEVGLWAALGGTCILVSRRYGSGRLSVDFGLRFKRRDLLTGLGAFVVAIIVAQVITSLFAHSKLQGTNSGIVTSQKGNTAGTVIVTLIVAVGAPLFEELFFRGFLLTSLSARLGAAAVGAQAILFGLAHYQAGHGWQNVSVMAAIGGMGLVLGYTARRTGRLAAGMLAHGMFNLLATLTILLGPGLILGRAR
jgi:membrane protease YdiL (CAAX protease family)